MAKFLTTQRGGRKLIFNGYAYVKKDFRATNGIRWRCDKAATLKCLALAKTRLDPVDNDVVEERGFHTHAPDPNIEDLIRIKNKRSSNRMDIVGKIGGGGGGSGSDSANASGGGSGEELNNDDDGGGEDEHVWNEEIDRHLMAAEHRNEDFGRAQYIESETLDKYLLLCQSLINPNLYYLYNRRASKRGDDGTTPIFYFQCVRCLKISPTNAANVFVANECVIKDPDAGHHHTCQPFTEFEIEVLRIRRALRRRVLTNGMKPAEAYTDILQEAQLRMPPAVFEKLKAEIGEYRQNKHALFRIAKMYADMNGIPYAIGRSKGGPRGPRKRKSAPADIRTSSQGGSAQRTQRIRKAIDRSEPQPKRTRAAALRLSEQQHPLPMQAEYETAMAVQQIEESGPIMDDDEPPPTTPMRPQSSPQRVRASIPIGVKRLTTFGGSTGNTSVRSILSQSSPRVIAIAVGSRLPPQPMPMPMRETIRAPSPIPVQRQQHHHNLPPSPIMDEPDDDEQDDDVPNIGEPFRPQPQVSGTPRLSSRASQQQLKPEVISSHRVLTALEKALDLAKRKNRWEIFGEYVGRRLESLPELNARRVMTNIQQLFLEEEQFIESSLVLQHANRY